MRREFLIALAISLAVLAGGLVVYQWTAAPTTLKVAVGPMGSENTRLVVALQQYMARERSTVRLRLVLTEGVDASAKAVEDDKADLAIVRTDVAMPVKAQTVAIMHRDAALLMTTPESGISKVSGLYGRNVGVVARSRRTARSSRPGSRIMRSRATASSSSPWARTRSRRRCARNASTRCSPSAP